MTRRNLCIDNPSDERKPSHEPRKVHVGCHLQQYSIYLYLHKLFLDTVEASTTADDVEVTLGGKIVRLGQVDLGGIHDVGSA